MVLATVLNTEDYCSAESFIKAKKAEKWAEKTYGMDWIRDSINDYGCDEDIINDYLREQRGTYLVVYQQEWDGFLIYKIGGMRKC